MDYDMPGVRTVSPPGLKAKFVLPLFFGTALKKRHTRAKVSVPTE